MKLDGQELLDYLVENELLIARPLVPTSSFVKFCKDRGIDTSSEQLERLEQLRILLPVARIDRPKYKAKVEYTPDRKQYRWLGKLDDGEEWNGETIEEYSDFSFRREFAASWRAEGLLWSPVSRPFVPWSTLKGDSWKEKTTSFYSEFQCYSLGQYQGWSRMTLGAEWECDRDEQVAAEQRAKIREWAGSVVKGFQDNRRSSGSVANLCQVLANRYYFNTQGDRRTITVSGATDWPDWNWYKYCRDWDAARVLDGLGLTPDDVRGIHERLCTDAWFIDPMASWYDLVQFVSVQEKRRLKGPALYAQLLYSMEHMLRLFYRDLTGKELYPPDESPSFTRERYYGEGVPSDERKYLEFLTNKYHLNPKPRLILVVEGESEEQHLPRLVEQAFGLSFAKLGIEVFNLQGVAQFEGKKRADSYGALEKFIDYHHARQTIVFVVLDNESRARTVAGRLGRKPSQRFSGRTVTKPEYLHTWDSNIEFDNFSDAELADALTAMADAKVVFAAEDVASCRKDARGNLLERTYTGKGGQRFSKVRLLGILVDKILGNLEAERDDEGQLKRPILTVMRRIIELAGRNHPAVTLDIWKKNQESGYLGDILEFRSDSAAADYEE